MARKCDCPKPRRPPSRAQRAYAAARREAVSSCLQRSPGPGRAQPLQLQPLKKAKPRKGTSAVLRGIRQLGSSKGLFGGLFGSSTGSWTGGKEGSGKSEAAMYKYGYGSESDSKFSSFKG